MTATHKELLQSGAPTNRRRCRWSFYRTLLVPNRFIATFLLLLATTLLVADTTLGWTVAPAIATNRRSGLFGHNFVSQQQRHQRSFLRSKSSTRLYWSATNSTDNEHYATVASSSRHSDSDSDSPSTSTSTSTRETNNSSDCLILVDADATFQAISLWNKTSDEESPLTNSDETTEQVVTKPAAPFAYSLPSSGTTIREIAIVLNTNARGVTDELLATARDVVREFDDGLQCPVGPKGEEDPERAVRIRVLVTSTQDEAREAAKDIVASASASFRPTSASPTTLVIPVGGDGTLTTMINLLWQEHSALLRNDDSSSSSSSSEKNHLDAAGNEPNDISHDTPTETTITEPNDIPLGAAAAAATLDRDSFPIMFGYVAMGTGNALGSVVGCRPVVGATDTAARDTGIPRGDTTSAHKGRPTRRKRAIAATKRVWKRLFRPNRTKCQEFKLVLKQLIEATTGGLSAPAPTATQYFPNMDPSVEMDIVDLPLIHVRTTKAGITHPNTNVEAIEEEDYYAFFAGLGYDSLVLQDYMDLQDRNSTTNGRGPIQLVWSQLRQLATTGVPGYTVAMMTRSLPKVLRLTDASRLLRDVRITTDQPDSAFWIDHRRGDLMRPAAATAAPGAFPAKEKEPQSLLLYRGSAGIVATGSVPYYGGGLRLFPFARMTPNGMHLRIGRQLHPLEGILHIPSIFRGSYRNNQLKCLDFVGNRFAVEIYESFSIGSSDGDVPPPSESELNIFDAKDRTEVGFPVQHSGESVGRCTRVEFTVCSSSDAQSGSSHGRATNLAVPPPVRFVTLMPSRIVEERIDMDP